MNDEKIPQEIFNFLQQRAEVGSEEEALLMILQNNILMLDQYKEKLVTTPDESIISVAKNVLNSLEEFTKNIDKYQLLFPIYKDLLDKLRSIVGFNYHSLARRIREELNK